MKRARSPQILDVSWGKTVVEEADGTTRTYKDAKLWPGGCRAWDWNETGTSHSPGIQRDDVKELVENGAESIVLSRGMNRRLQVKEQTLDWLDENGVEVEVCETTRAVERYNELAAESPAGALIHSTC